MSTPNLTAAKPPDPDSLGRIRKIVQAAHKWGGDGKTPSFRKIRRVLLAKHPEVIAKAFGGNPDVAAGWIKTNWYRQRGRDVPPTRGKKAVTAMSDTYFGVHVLTEDEERSIIEMGVSDVLTSAAPKTEVDDDGMIVKTIMRTGKWKYWPNGQKKELDIDKAFLEDVVKAFKAGVVPHVTIPFNSHDDTDMTTNVGFVRDVWIEKSKRKDDRWLLKGKLEFTEPDVKAKVERGTYPDVSVFVDMRGVRDPESGKIWPRVLKHTTITHRPFISEMNDKKLAAIAAGEGLQTWELDIDDETEAEIATMFGDVVGAKTGDVAWNDDQDWDNLREKLSATLRSPDFRQYPEGNPMPPEANLWLWKMSSDKALIRVTEGWGPEHEPRFFVAGWEMSSGSAVIDPPDEWTEVHQRWIQASSQDLIWSATFTDDNPENETEGSTPVAATSGEATGGGSPQDGTLTFTQEQLDTLLAKRDADREAQLATLEARLAASEERDKVQAKKLHEKDVDALAAKWEGAKIAPAVITTALEMIRPETASTEMVLSMSSLQKGDDGAETVVKTDLNLMQVVDKLICSMPSAQDGGGSAGLRIAEVHGDAPATGRFTAIQGGGETDINKAADELEADLGVEPVASTTSA